MSCAVCLRDGRGFAFQDPVPSAFPKPIYHACSMGHLDVVMAYWKVAQMLNPTRHEQAAILLASDKAGEYLERLGKTDLVTLTQPEWMGLVQLIFEASTHEIGRLTDQESPQ